MYILKINNKIQSHYFLCFLHFLFRIFRLYLSNNFPYDKNQYGDFSNNRGIN